MFQETRNCYIRYTYYLYGIQFSIKYVSLHIILESKWHILTLCID